MKTANSDNKIESSIAKLKRIIEEVRQENARLPAEQRRARSEAAARDEVYEAFAWEMGQERGPA